VYLNHRISENTLAKIDKWYKL